LRCAAEGRFANPRPFSAQLARRERSAQAVVGPMDDAVLLRPEKDRKMWLEIEKGVSINLATEKEGVELNLGLDGSVIEWDNWKIRLSER
jgi:hypothetical protein